MGDVTEKLTQNKAPNYFIYFIEIHIDLSTLHRKLRDIERDKKGKKP